MKIVSWNVNSIRKGIENELLKLIGEQEPDILCFQETKATGQDAEEFFNKSKCFELYPYRYWNDSVSGQAGVSIWSKIKPMNVIKEVPRIYKLKEGRVLVLEFEEFTLLNTYVPNTGRGEIAEQQRNVWHNAIVGWLADQFENDKLLIWCGDLNVVSEPVLDTSHHKIRPKKGSAGLKQFEKDQFDEYIELGLSDAFRNLYPDTVSFTWYSPRNPGVGWRLDYFLVNDMSIVKDVIHYEKLPSTVSDHVPIILIILPVLTNC